MTDNELKEYILANFQYHADGTITRSDRKNSNGFYDKDGYLKVKVKKKALLVHRVVWLLNHGDFPRLEIDHINRNKTDNRIENLREATRWENNINKEFKVNPTTGVVGIAYDTSTKGLLARYTFRCCGKTYRFRKLEDAVREKERLRNDLRKANENTRRLICSERSEK